MCRAGLQANSETYEELAPTETARQHKDPPITWGNTERVRRLTPLECERLQGFPDGWTDIPYKGKEAPDSPRYKALGNSFAVPVVRWIGERMQMVEDIRKDPH